MDENKGDIKQTKNWLKINWKGKDLQAERNEREKELKKEKNWRRGKWRKT